MLAALLLRRLHVGWAWFVIIGNGLAGAWALAAHYSEGLRRRALWWFTIIAEVSMFVEVALGVAVVNAEHLDPPKFHMLYGFFGLMFIGIIYSYRTTSPWVRERVYLVYGASGFFIMGLGIRAMLVGGT